MASRSPSGSENKGLPPGNLNFHSTARVNHTQRNPPNEEWIELSPPEQDLDKRNEGDNEEGKTRSDERRGSAFSIAIGNFIDHFYARRGKREEREGPAAPAAEESDYWTHLGLTPQSFKRKKQTGDAELGLKEALEKRHIYMIAIGGSIGAGLFVGSGNALHNAGPASVVIDFTIIGVMIILVCFALGELAISYPVEGGFYIYSSRFIDPSWGFAMGWNYVLQWAVVLPLELTVASLTVNYWPNSVHIAVWITIFLIMIVIINAFGVCGYGEFEFLAVLLKLCAIIIFMIVALALVCGGGPSDGKYNHYIGAHYWYNPGSFNNGFKGFCEVFVTAAFSYSGTEIVGLTAAESKDPVNTLPTAIKQVVWRVILFFILGVFFMTLLVPYDDDRLLGSSGGVMDAATSPFVIVGKDAHLTGYDSFMNVIILVSVLSIGNAGIYGGSRTLVAMAHAGYAPKCFDYVDRAGRPLVAVLVLIGFGGLAYINCSASGDTVFAWLQALSGLAALFTWGSICLAHIRFRKAWAMRKRDLREIRYKSPFGIWGSWVGFILNILVLVAQFYSAIWPPGQKRNDAKGFFQSYLAFFVAIFFYLIGWWWKRKGWINQENIDLDTGFRHFDVAALARRDQERKHAPWWKRFFYFMF